MIQILKSEFDYTKFQKKSLSRSNFECAEIPSISYLKLCKSYEQVSSQPRYLLTQFNTYPHFGDVLRARCHAGNQGHILQQASSHPENAQINHQLYYAHKFEEKKNNNKMVNEIPIHLSSAVVLAITQIHANKLSTFTQPQTVYC